MDSADWGEVFGFEVANGFEVLEANALVVLGSAGEYFRRRIWRWRREGGAIWKARRRRSQCGNWRGGKCLSLARWGGGEAFLEWIRRCGIRDWWSEPGIWGRKWWTSSMGLGVLCWFRVRVKDSKILIVKKKRENNKILIVSWQISRLLQQLWRNHWDDTLGAVDLEPWCCCWWWWVGADGELVGDSFFFLSQI